MHCCGVAGDDAPVSGGWDGVALYVKKVSPPSHKSNGNIFFLFLLFLQHRAVIQRSSTRAGPSNGLDVSQRYLQNPVGVEPRLCFCSRPTGLLLQDKRSCRRANQRAGICARLVSESIELSLCTVIARR